MASSVEEIITQIIPEFLSFIGVAIGLLGGYFIARKRYGFEKIYEQRLICLKDLYERVVNLEFLLKKYVHFIGADMEKETMDGRIKSLNEVKSSFQEFQHKFWREEIILDENTTEIINNFLTKYIEITSKLTVSNIQLQQGDLVQSFDNWNNSFKLVKSDLSQVKDEIKKEFRKTLKIRKWKINFWK